MTPCHLSVASCYSLLRGTFRPAQLVEKAAELGYEAMTLTDYRGLYGAIPFYQAALEKGIRPILGAAFPTPHALGRLTLLAQNAQGYGNLCRIITADQWLRPKASVPSQRPPCPLAGIQTGMSTADLLLRYPQGLFALCSDLSWLKQLNGKLPEGALYGEAFQGPDRHWRNHFRGIRHWCEAHRVPRVATNRVHFLEVGDYRLHRLLTAIRTGGMVERLEEEEAAPPECRLWGPEEFSRRFREDGAALEATDRLAAACEVELPAGKPRYPYFEFPDGESPERGLRRLCEEALPKCYSPSQQAAARARLDHELAIIQSKGVASYFLVVWDLVRWARQKGIPSTGRGSAADSLTAYLLGLTHVDPIALNLYFERFLSEERSSPPDIDMDLCWRRRDEVVDYVYQRWGADRTAMISAHIRLAGRSCFRETGKALGFSEMEMNRLTRHLPHWGPVDVARLHDDRPESRDLRWEEEPLRTLLPLAEEVQGLPTHLGVHASGIVVAPEPLTDWTPLEPAAKGLLVTQYDMGPLEDLGYMKIDLLGQRSLTVVQDCARKLPPETLPDIPAIEGDKATGDLIASGRTMGVFQLESPAMRGILKRVQARDFETVMAASSVIRPGPKDSGMLKSWIRRKRGLERISFLHPSLEEALRETLGILVYQEDVMKVARIVAGFSLGQADILRRSMSMKSRDVRLADLETEFLAGAASRGIAPTSARQIWQQMKSFAGYAFCKAHSASYTVLSLQAAFLKAHYPTAFLAAVLANGGGFYHAGAYVSEARRWKIPLLLPCLNRSEKTWAAQGRAIRCGFDRLRDFRAKSLEIILKDRHEKGPYPGFSEAWRRLPEITPAEWEALIMAGALDGLPEDPWNRPQKKWLLDRWSQSTPKSGSGEQLDFLTKDPLLENRLPPALPDYPEERLFEDEQAALGLALRHHPLWKYRSGLPSIFAGQKVEPAARMAERIHRSMALAGWLVSSKRVRGKNGRPLKFLTLEDESDIYEAVLFDRAYQRFGAMTGTAGPYLLFGQVREEEGHCSLHVDILENWGKGPCGGR